MRKWIAFLIMAVGLGIGFFTSDMAWHLRIMALLVIFGFGAFLWKYHTLKDLFRKTKKEFNGDMKKIKDKFDSND